MKQMFNIVTTTSAWAGRIAKMGLSLLMLVAFWGAITATSIFGFYILSSAVMSVFVILALIVGIAACIWVVGFVWKLFRLFSPSVETIETEPVTPTASAEPSVILQTS